MSCPCCTHCYDCLRALFNPKSVAYGPCTGRKKAYPDAHEAYYTLFVGDSAATTGNNAVAMGGNAVAGNAVANVEQKKRDLLGAKELIKELVKSKSCAPILVRLAWHDSGTYDKANAGKAWPNAGGAIGSIITPHEIEAGPNAGLKKGYTAYLDPIKKQFPGVSWADLIQLASATAIEVAGGPAVDMKYGRVDGIPTELQPAPFGLPAAFPDEPVAHLKEVFYKYGMDDKDIVALSGAHTLGRAFKDRSGTVEEGSSGPFTAYTKRGCPMMANSLTAGGRSWTKEWTKFDNTYFTDMAKKDPECIAFPTDTCLMSAPEFKVHFDAFAKDQNAFFSAYKVSHKKLSELGSKFDPPEGITGI